jgi:signal transduction histidine kinase
MRIAADSNVRKSSLDLESAQDKAPARLDAEAIATLAHEIRNILSPLGSACELLHALELEDAAAREATSVIGRQVRRLKRLTSDLLDAHRLWHDGVRLMLRRTDLREALAAIYSDHRALFAARAIELVPQWNLEPVWAEVDPDRLDQVLNNLLSNSLKFTDREGRVFLGLTIDSERHAAVISVRDTGIGMSRDVIDAIFNLHFHDSSARNRAGLGLGLPLAKRLIELHGGCLEVESAGPGCGATFRVVLPLSKQGTAVVQN